TTDLLNCQILENEGGIVAISAKAAPDFTQSPNTDEGVYQTTDLDGTSLYYRGAVTDNYVSFLDYYWRIIRINGDGSVRLIYAGKVEDVGEVAYANNYNDSVNKITSLGSAGYNITTNDAKYLGWTYDNQTTVQNSNLKNYLNEWYTGFDNTVDPAQATTKFTYPGDIPGLTSYAINFGNTKFCNDTSSSLATRMSSAQPSLDCPEIVDPDFGGSYTAKVGLISVDEMIMAGVNNSWTTNNSYLNQGYTFWTMSPVTFDSTAQMYTNPGFNNGKQNVDTVVPVRPVISLAKESTVVSGTGIASDPYFIQAIH
ncbi:MAG TPA: hypothetical protein PK737_02765, partial [Bacilli bacterium]|nr:hypothetical protein [Bacilli bacterium]